MEETQKVYVRTDASRFQPEVKLNNFEGMRILMEGVCRGVCMSVCVCVGGG